MTAKIRILVLSVYLIQYNTLYSLGENIIIEGTYQGKNLYVKNPIINELADSCVTAVYVNEVKAPINLRSSALEIDLSFLQFHDAVHIMIIHKDGCHPIILNSNVLKHVSSFTFSTITMDDKNVYWSTKSESKPGEYYVEQLIHNKWVVKAETKSKSGADSNFYQQKVLHHSGQNKYRLKLKDNSGQSFYSKTVEYFSQSDQITFYPKKATDKITLSRKSQYEVMDKNGISLLRGDGLYFSVLTLPPGEYLLNIDNRTEKFSKH